MDKLRANRVIILIFALVIFPALFYLFLPNYIQVAFIVTWGIIITIMLGAIVAYMIVDIRNKSLIYPNENGYLPTIKRGKRFVDLNAVGAVYSGGNLTFDQERQALIHYLTRAGGTQPREVMDRVFAANEPEPSIKVIQSPGTSNVIDAVAQEL